MLDLPVMGLMEEVVVSGFGRDAYDEALQNQPDLFDDLCYDLVGKHIVCEKRRDPFRTGSCCGESGPGF